MIFTSDKQQFAPEELRTAFADLVQEVIDSRDPAEGAELLYDDEPEQLSFNFSISK